MKKTLKNTSYSLLSKLLYKTADYAGERAASMWGLYQPKAPKCLKK